MNEQVPEPEEHTQEPLPQAEPSPSTFGRRDALRVALGFGAGVAAGVTVDRVGFTDEAVEGVSGAEALRPEADTITAEWIPETVKYWGPTINEMAAKYKVDSNLIAIIMTIETGGASKEISPAGAIGPMQVTPEAAETAARSYLKDFGASTYDLHDPRTNIEFGTSILAHLRDEFAMPEHGPSWILSAEIVGAGYNGGPGAANSLDQGEGLTDEQTVAYCRDVMNMWRERHAKSSPTYQRWLERGGQRLVDLARAE